MLKSRIVLLAFSCLLTQPVFAAETKLTVPLDYTLLRNVLVKELYTQANETARLWKDGKDCSFLDLDHPEISSENGELKLDNQVHARIGVTLAGRCIPAVEWRGKLQTFQKPIIEAKNKVLRFPVTHVLAFDNNNQPLNVKELQGLIDQAVQAKLSDLKIDLTQAETEISKNLSRFMSAEDHDSLQSSLKSLKFEQIEINENDLQLSLAFKNPKQPKLALEPALTSAELTAWQTVWAKFEQNVQTALKKPPLSSQSVEDLAALQDVLQSANAAFSQGLTSEDLTTDPVREYLQSSWDKLEPLLRHAAKQMTGTDGLQFLTLLSATNLMVELDNIVSPFGLDISANGLRKLARAYLAKQ